MTEETKYKDKWCQEAYERGKAEATKELQEEINKQENYRLAQDSKISFLITDNEQLKAQIEKMKCCQNCKHHYFMGNDLECKLIDCDNNESWELAE